MATEKKLKKISDEEFNKGSISTLATRPNAPANFGTGGLSSSNLRKRFDTLPELLKERINAIIDAFESGDAAGEFYVMLDGKKYPLAELVGMITTGDLAKLMKASERESEQGTEELKTLQDIIWNVYRLLSDKLEKKTLAWNDNGTELANEADKNKGEYTRTVVAHDRFAVQKVTPGEADPSTNAEINEKGMRAASDDTTAQFSADGIHFERKASDGSSIEATLSFPKLEENDEIAPLSLVNKKNEEAAGYASNAALSAEQAEEAKGEAERYANEAGAAAATEARNIVKNGFEVSAQGQLTKMDVSNDGVTVIYSANGIKDTIKYTDGKIVRTKISGGSEGKIELLVPDPLSSSSDSNTLVLFKDLDPLFDYCQYLETGVSVVKENGVIITGMQVDSDPSTYKYTFQLRGKKFAKNINDISIGDEENIGKAVTIDLPLESVVVNGKYEKDSKYVVLTLNNGNTVSFSVEDLVSGLVSSTELDEKLDPMWGFMTSAMDLALANDKEIDTNNNKISEIEDKIEDIENQMYDDESIKKIVADEIKDRITADEAEEIVKKETADKYTPDVSTIEVSETDGSVAYKEQDSNTYHRADIMQNAGPYSIARRGKDGSLKVGEAKEDDDAPPKKYVDDKDVTSLSIEPATNDDGKISGVYDIKIHLGSGDVLSAHLDLPFESVQIASVDDYLDQDGARFLKITFVDEKISPINVKLDDIFKGAGEITEDIINQKIDDATVGKVDKIEPPQPNIQYAYTTARTAANGVSHGLYPLSSQSTPYTMAVRDENGALNVGEPIEDSHAVNLKYLEENVLPKPTASLAQSYGDGYIAQLDASGKTASRKFISGQYIGAYTIPYRMANGELCVGTPSQATHAVNKEYFDKATAPIADHEKRIENLEGTLLTFGEDSSLAYVKNAPAGSAPNVMLNSIGGRSKKSKNLLPYMTKGLRLMSAGEGRFWYIRPGESKVLACGLEIQLNLDGSIHLYASEPTTATSRIDFLWGSGANEVIEGDTIAYVPIGGLQVSGDYTFSVGAATLPDDCTVSAHKFDTSSSNFFSALKTGYSEFTMNCTDLECNNIQLVCLQIIHDSTIDTTIYPMLNEGGTAEPFEINEGITHSAVTSVTHDKYSVNRFDFSHLEFPYVSVSFFEDGFMLPGYSNVISNLKPSQFMEMTGLKPGDTYTATLKAEPLDGTPLKNLPWLQVNRTDNSDEFILIGNGKTITLPDDFSDEIYGGMVNFLGQANDADGTKHPTKVTEITITKGTEAAPYQPYSSEHMDSVFIPEEILRLPDYGKEFTYIDFDRKVFVDAGCDVTFDGDELWGIDDPEGDNPDFYFNAKVSPKPDVSTTTPATVTEGFKDVIHQVKYRIPKESVRTMGSNSTIYFHSDVATTLAQWKAYLAANPVKVRYRVAEPVEYDISEYLTDYGRYKTLSVGSGDIVFQNEKKNEVPSTITYVKAKE